MKIRQMLESFKSSGMLIKVDEKMKSFVVANHLLMAFVLIVVVVYLGAFKRFKGTDGRPAGGAQSSLLTHTLVSCLLVCLAAHQRIPNTTLRPQCCFVHCF